MLSVFLSSFKSTKVFVISCIVFPPKQTSLYCVHNSSYCWKSVGDVDFQYGRHSIWPPPWLPTWPFLVILDE